MGAIENIRVNHGLAALIHNDLQRLHIPVGIAGDDGAVALNQDCIAAVHSLGNIFGTSVCITVDPRTVFHIHAGDLCKVVDHRNHIFTCAGHSNHIRIGHMLDDGAILAVINGLMDLGALGCNAGNAQPGLQIHINGLSANGQAKGLAVANRGSQITNALRHSHSAILFQVKVALTFVRICLCPGMAQIVVLDHPLAALLQCVCNLKGLLIGIAHAQRAMVHQHNGTAARVHHNAHLHLLAQRIGGRHSIIGAGHLRAQDRLKFLVNIADLHAGNADDGGRLLVGVDHKIHGGMVAIRRSVHTLLGRGLNLALIGAVLNINHNHFFRCQRFIRPTGGCDHKLGVRNTGGYIAPGTGDQTAFHQLFAGRNDQLFCFF